MSGSVHIGVNIAVGTARTGMSGIALGGACGLGDYIRIAVTGCTAAGHTTGRTGFRLGASCILPIMSQGFSTGLTTCGTGFGGRTGCVFPTVAQGVAAGLSALGAGLGILAGCCAVAMTGGSYDRIGIAVVAACAGVGSITIFCAGGVGNHSGVAMPQSGTGFFATVGTGGGFRA